jgi:hypothetical protein
MATGTSEQTNASDLRHLEGCPEDDERVEHYKERQVTGRNAGRLVRVTRCRDCGAHLVTPISGVVEWHEDDDGNVEEEEA